MALLMSANSVDAAPEVLEGHEEYVYMLSFSRDGRLLVTASGDNTAIVWDVAQRKSVHVLDHDAVAFSGDGQTLAAVGDDHRLRCWNVEEFRLESDREMTSRALYAVAFAPGQPHILVAGEGGIVYLIAKVDAASQP